MHYLPLSQGLPGNYQRHREGDPSSVGVDFERHPLATAYLKLKQGRNVDQNDD